MSETFFHLLGPGTQPNDDSFSMNPLPITCRVNGEPSMAALEQCAHSPQVIALLNELQHQLSERQPPLGEVLAVDLLNLNADDRHFINTLLGEGEVSVRIQQADDSESEIQEAIFCGLWRVRRRHGEQLLEDKLEALKNAPPREIRTEVVKPVFTNKCLSDDFVSMYNDAVTSTERTLSGKPEN